MRKQEKEFPFVLLVSICISLIAIILLGIVICCKVIWSGTSEGETKKPENPATSGISQQQTTGQSSTDQPKESEASTEDSSSTEEVSTKYAGAFVPDSVEKIDEALNSPYLRLVNVDHPVGEAYVPENLADADSGEQMDGRVAEYGIALIEDAREAGFTDLYMCSGYRTYEWQYDHYYGSIENYIAQGYSEEEANRLTARDYMFPGASEHQYGMCMDIVTYSYVGEYGLTAGFEDTDCWKWIDENDYKYGFILRYAEEKESITGIMYEPWHYRYVGSEHAAYMKEHNMCLEEYVAFLQEKREELSNN